MLWASRRYEIIKSDSDDEPDESASSLVKLKPSMTVIIEVTVIVIASGLVGFLMGRLSVTEGIEGVSTTGYLGPQGNLWTRMEYNRTFTDSPSNRTNNAWASLFPEGVGFVVHPDIAKKPSGVSVFHQLHCLNSLRIAYYAAFASSSRELADINAHDDPHHVRHCIDYIRQSLMCAADTNIEPVDPMLGGSTGWGTLKTCRDYGAVRNWAETYRTTPQVT